MRFPTRLDGQRATAVGVTSATSRYSTLTAHASANTKGNYTELVASSAHAADAIIVFAGIGNANPLDSLIDIAIGGAGSEQVIIANLLRGTSGNIHMAPVLIPISIPAGSRIAGRVQASTGGTTTELGLILLKCGILGQMGILGVVTSYGPATADSGGVSVDPGAVANTKGSYSQITASTTRPIKWLVVAIGNAANNARTTAVWLMDIAIGGAGSEQIVIPDIVLGAHANSDEMLFALLSFPCSIPSGTRLAARAQCSITDATDRLFDVALYGVD